METQQKEYEAAYGAVTKIDRKPLYCAAKRVLDCICASVALVVLSPILLFVIIAIKLEDGGPAIHRRKCVGKENREYYMYKFRTMVTDADNLERYLTPEQIEQYKKETKLENDPRITKIGKFLRKSSTDELPQLVNVVKGEMSLVGPRPLTRDELHHFGEYVDLILSVTPGLTGYWQVNGRSDSTYESGKRQELELYYATHKSPWLDLKILLKTVGVVICGGGAH